MQPLDQLLDIIMEKVALVTGSSRGIGKAIALELGRSGMTTIVNFKDAKPEAQNTFDEIVRLGGRAAVYQADISDETAVKGMFDFIHHEFGGADVLVNNAGINLDRSLRKMRFDDWKRVLDVNLSGMFLCCQSALPHMIDRKYGRIVNISSIIGRTGAFGQTNYAAAKSGVLGLTKSLAFEVAKYNITVNAICPGYIDTDMVAGMPDEMLKQIESGIPLQRLGKPEEIARMARFLILEGDYMTGSTLNVNGGLFLG